MGSNLPGSQSTLTADDVDAATGEVIALGDMTTNQLLTELVKTGRLILIHLEAITGMQIDGSDVLWDS